MDLFKESSEARKAERGAAPLALRMRPRRLEEFVGQEHILGPGRLLRRAIKADRIGSLILYGPPGSGKTTLAEIIAEATHSAFVQISAVTSGVAELRAIAEQATQRLRLQEKKTILFVDEIHRFNKAQQDVLLPFVESGVITLIGTTTYNPFFYINSALVSRSKVFQLRPLTEPQVCAVMERALADRELGLGQYNVDVRPEAVAHLAKISEGDARRALNALEIAVLTTVEDDRGARHITLEVAEESIQMKAVVYDRDGDQHYDTISAFIKSLRGSDPDAALYWMAKMLYAGEDPRYVARRMIICAAEDVGMADPRALTVATAAMQAVDYVGMPEAQIPLAEAAVYIATAPKSNATYKGISKAMDDVRSDRLPEVPRHLRDASYASAKRLGHGEGYRYAHGYEGHIVEQDYGVPTGAYYTPTDQGYEREIAARIEQWKAALRRRADTQRRHERKARAEGGEG